MIYKNADIRCLLFLSVFLLFVTPKVTSQDHIIFQPNNDTLKCLSISVSSLPEGIVYFTNTHGNRDTLLNAYDTILEIKAHNRIIRNFGNNGFFWEKSVGRVQLYEQKTYHFWSRPEWGDLLIKPYKYFPHPSVVAGPKTETYIYQILIVDGDTLYSPKKKELRETVLPIIQANLLYLDPKEKFKVEDYEKYIKIINQKQRGDYEYFVNRLKDTVYCRGIQYDLQYGALSRFQYSDDYDVTFLLKNKRNCLSVASFQSDGIEYSTLENKFINKKFFFPGHFWNKRSGEIDLFYNAKMSLVIHPKTEIYISQIISKNMIRLPGGHMLEFTQDNFDQIIRDILNLNPAFKKHYMDESIKINDFVIDEMISFYNYTHQKSPADLTQQGL